SLQSCTFSLSRSKIYNLLNFSSFIKKKILKSKERGRDDGGVFANKKLRGNRMDSRCDGKRMNVDGDRLSSLPDDLIHKILSFVGIKKVVETSVLSSRW
ncbi:hypothetical protein M8C21_004422, partial [Ambrosia artemisiifolia]